MLQYAAVLVATYVVSESRNWSKCQPVQIIAYFTYVDDYTRNKWDYKCLHHHPAIRHGQYSCGVQVHPPGLFAYTNSVYLCMCVVLLFIPVWLAVKTAVTAFAVAFVCVRVHVHVPVHALGHKCKCIHVCGEAHMGIWWRSNNEMMFTKIYLLILNIIGCTCCSCIIFIVNYHLCN